jgi:hypothetical protein
MLVAWRRSLSWFIYVCDLQKIYFAYINNVALYQVSTVLYKHSIKDCKCDKLINEYIKKNQYFHKNANFMSLVQNNLCVYKSI